MPGNEEYIILGQVFQRVRNR